MRIYFFVLALLVAPLMRSETPLKPTADLEGGLIQRGSLPVEIVKPRIDRLTWTLLATDGGARVFDAWSTRRMLRNNCSSGIQLAGTSTCNYEQNLPAFITNHASGLYSFEAAAWVSEFAATHLLVRHHHPRLAKFVPLIDILSTTSFAANNLTLSIGNSGAAVSTTSKSRFLRDR